MVIPIIHLSFKDCHIAFPLDFFHWWREPWDCSITLQYHGTPFTLPITWLPTTKVETPYNSFRKTMVYWSSVTAINTLSVGTVEVIQVNNAKQKISLNLLSITLSIKFNTAAQLEVPLKVSRSHRTPSWTQSSCSSAKHWWDQLFFGARIFVFLFLMQNVRGTIKNWAQRVSCRKDPQRQ